MDSGLPSPPRKPTLPAFLLLIGMLLVVPEVSIAAPKPGSETSKHAEPSDEALKEARQKFQKALALQTGGDWAGALTLLKEVAALKSTPQVLFNIALCEENLGQLVAALGDYELAAADARAADIRLVEREALERLEKLRARIPHLRIDRGEGASRATVTLDGVDLGEAALGRNMPMDPGSYEVRAVVPGRPVFVTEVQLKEGEEATVLLEFGPLPVPPPASEPSPGVSTGRVLGYVSGGLGLASLAAAGAFHALSYDAQKQLDALCPTRTGCPEEGREIYARGQQHTLYRNVALGVGIVGVATGAVLWLTTSPTRETSASRARQKPRSVVAVGHGPTALGATWSGTF